MFIGVVLLSFLGQIGAVCLAGEDGSLDALLWSNDFEDESDGFFLLIGAKESWLV